MQAVDFLLIADPQIWSIPIKECHEPLVDLKELGFSIRQPRGFFSQFATYAGFTKVRQSVANKLLNAINTLPHGYTFLFAEGHRPVSLQSKMYRFYCQELTRLNPHWKPEKIKQETIKFVAPAEDVPPHSTGGAIDITLMDANGNELDMGTALDEKPGQQENRNFTFAINIPQHAKKNRQILIDALTKEDFVNYPAEWWHWSFGDKYWAYHNPHEKIAIYDSIAE